MAIPQSTADLYATQRNLQRRTLAKVRRAWSSMNPLTFDASWQQIAPAVLLAITAAQEQAATTGADYVPVVLAELGIDAAASGAVNPQLLAGIAASGYPLPSVLYNVIIDAKTRVLDGATGRQALRGASSLLDGITVSQVADAGRVSTGVGITAVKHVQGYVRMLNPPSCSRCVVLSGKFYRWNTGFERHPRCDCQHIPAQEDSAGDFRTSPRAYFDRLTTAEQDAQYTKAGAQAIRDGADISQVVNVSRGLSTAGGRTSSGPAQRRRQVFTTEGTTRHGVAGRAARSRGVSPQRLMPEAIYQIAQNRDDAIRLLKLYGYLI